VLATGLRNQTIQQGRGFFQNPDEEDDSSADEEELVEIASAEAKKVPSRVSRTAVDCVQALLLLRVADLTPASTLPRHSVLNYRMKFGSTLRN